MSAKRRQQLPSPPPDGDGFYGVDDGSLYGGMEVAAEEEQG